MATDDVIDMVEELDVGTENGKQVDNLEDEIEKNIEEDGDEIANDWPSYINIMNSDFSDVDTFVISMDCLFVELISHDYLDWTLGGQSLVVVFMLERFLQSLKEKGGRYKLVWFDSMTVIFDSCPVLAFMYQILRKHAESSHNLAIDVEIFTGPLSHDWKKFLDVLSPSFIMISTSAPPNETFPEFPTKCYESCMTSLVVHCLHQNVSTVDFNQMETQNFASLYAFKRRPYSKLQMQSDEQVLHPWTELESSKSENPFEGGHLSGLTSPELFWTEVLSKTHVTQKEDHAIFRQSFMLSVCLSSQLPLNLQAQQEMCQLPNKLKENFNVILKTAGQLLKAIGDTQSLPNPIYCIINGRFAASVISFCQQEKSIQIVPECVFPQFRKCCEKLGMEPLWEIDSSATEEAINIDSKRNEESPRKTMPHLDIELMKNFVGNLYKEISGSGSLGKQRGLDTAKQFHEDYHWHSGRLLADDFQNPPAPANATGRWLMKQQQRLAGWYQFYGESLESGGNQVKFHSNALSTQSASGMKKKDKKKALPKLSAKAKNIIEANQLKKLEQQKRMELDRLESAEKQLDEFPDALQKIQKLDDILHHSVCPEIIIMRQIMILRHDYLDECKSGVDLNLRRICAIMLVKKLVFITKCHWAALAEGDQEEVKRIYKELGICPDSGKKLSGQTKYGLEMDLLDYQMRHAGDTIEIQSDAKADPRVEGFEPDAWQRELLDIVDKNNSALIVAPTSAGKTFVSYYCIDKVLSETDDGIVIYVSPTKALVNQVAATVYARFKDKTRDDAGSKLFGVFTRDVKHDVVTSRVLLTIPQCLEILLLAPFSERWRSKIKYVIFDEIHCIGGGVGDVLGAEIWEHIILLIHCPFLALSATIGNPKSLHHWLKNAEMTKSTSRQVELIDYGERYSELELIMYNLKDKGTKRRAPYQLFNPMAIHDPTVSVSIPEDQQLTALQIYEFFLALTNVDPSLEASLSPRNYFGKNEGMHWLTRHDLRQFESALIDQYVAWINGDDIQGTKAKKVHDVLLASNKKELNYRSKPFSEKNAIDGTIVELADLLNKQKMLPCLCFSDNRGLCERLALTLHKTLIKYENAFRNRPENRAREEAFSKSQEMAEKKQKRSRDEKTHKQKGKNEESDMMQDDADKGEDQSIQQSVYSLSEMALFTLGKSGLGNDLFNKIADRVRWRDGNNSNTKLFLDLLNRGIGYHHSGMSTSQKQAVEMLFRAGHLQIVFSTSTLALGINMPCKTVVFICDSPYLTPLQYRQMSGRAGRRGFDTTGNVIFLAIPKKKINQLLCSKLPDLRGNIPISIGFVLRLLILIDGVKDVKGMGRNADIGSKQQRAMRSALAVLKNPFLAHTMKTIAGEDVSKRLNEQLKHFFVFSCQFLHKMNFIDIQGQPIGLAGIVSHLSYNQPGNMLLCYLLKEGLFHRLCDQFHLKTAEDRMTIKDSMVLVLSHLFTDVKLPHNVCTEKFDNSVVLLEALPEEFESAVYAYNKEVSSFFLEFLQSLTRSRQVEVAYLSVTMEPVKSESDLVGGGKLLNHMVNKMSSQNSVQGPVFALAGNSDVNIDLLKPYLVYPLDQGIYFDPTFIPTKHYPYIDHRGKPVQLNSYALDFWKHGIIQAIVRDNKCREGDAWNFLKDFSLTIKAISQVLEQLGPVDDCVVKAFAELATEFHVKFRQI